MKTVIPVEQMSPLLRKLLKNRNQARTERNFTQSDKIKEELLKMGFEIRDSISGTDLLQDTVTKTIHNESYMLLFGSGEIAAVSQEAHSYVFEQIGKSSINIVILSTPAGFQPNVELVYQEVADFFAHSLQNFHPNIKVVYANNKSLANDQNIIDPLNTADYIFTGPGSPTYAVNQLNGTKALALIQKRQKEGVSLGLASAATIAWSKKTLPVYEIYKVGTELHWQNGLNALPDFLSFRSVIPHFNNNEGGDKTDTSHCYMGKERFKRLLNLLPKETSLVGIDEHTALIINNYNHDMKIIGQGYPHLIGIDTGPLSG
jgi:cyanophycinase-like exopeptidase